MPSAPGGSTSVSVVLLPAHTMRNVAEGRGMHLPKHPRVYRSGTPNAPEGEAQAVLPWELSVGSTKGPLPIALFGLWGWEGLPLLQLHPRSSAPWDVPAAGLSPSPPRLDGEVAPKPWRFGTSPLPRRSSLGLCHPIRRHLLNPLWLFSLRIAPHFSPWVCRELWPGCGARRHGEATGGAGCVRQSSRGSSDIPFGSLKMSVLETF